MGVNWSSQLDRGLRSPKSFLLCTISQQLRFWNGGWIPRDSHEILQKPLVCTVPNPGWTSKDGGPNTSNPRKWMACGHGLLLIFYYHEEHSSSFHWHDVDHPIGQVQFYRGCCTLPWALQVGSSSWANQVAETLGNTTAVSVNPLAVNKQHQDLSPLFWRLKLQDDHCITNRSTLFLTRW